MKKLFTLGILLASMCGAIAQNGTYKTALTKNSRFRYNDTGKDVGTQYTAPFYEDTPSYVDADWKSGNGTFGYGETYINTTTNFGANPLAKHITTYFINNDLKFASNGADFDSLFLYVRYDDGFVAFWNGKEIARRNMLPASINTSTALTDHEGLLYEKIDLTAFKNDFLSLGGFFSAEVHQNSPSSDDLVFDCEVIYFTANETPTANQTTHKPYLMMGTPSSVEVRWQTSLPTTTSLNYGVAQNNLNLVYTDTAKVKEHKAFIKNLKADTKYFYSLNNAPAFVNMVAEQYFHTNPVKGTENKYRFWVLGDFGLGLPTQQAVLGNYTANKGGFVDAWLWLGDNAYDKGTDAEYQKNVFDVYPDIFRNHMLYPSPGNHDMGSCNAAAGTGTGPYFELFDVFMSAEAGGLPSATEAYYSYDYGNIHFISLESTQLDKGTTAAMASWMRKDLQQNNQKWTIAYWHHPPYSKGSHDSDNEGGLTQMRENILPILEQYGVDLVMTGHSHCYERSYMVDSHYGYSSTFKDSMLSYGKKDGRVGSDGAYLKPKDKNYSHKGTVYMVNGTGGSIDAGSQLNHPVNYKSYEEPGSVILEIHGDTLTSTFINAGNAANDDQFTIIKSKVEPCNIKFNLGNDITISNGDSINLNASIKFLSYAWNTGATTPSINVKEAGQYICTVGVSATCFKSDTINVNVNMDAAINLGPDTTICEGNSITIGAGNNFVAYNWNTGATTAKINVNRAGTYILTVRAANNSVATDTIIVNSKVIPVANILKAKTEYGVNELVELEANGTAESYNWDFGDFAKADGSKVSHVYPVEGTFIVTLETSNGNCTSVTYDTIIVVNKNVSVFNKTDNKFGIKVYPNPADETVTIEINRAISPMLNVNVIDARGVRKFGNNYNLNTNQSNLITIDIDSWEAGLYTIVAMNAGMVAECKFVASGAR